MVSLICCDEEFSEKDEYKRKVLQLPDTVDELLDAGVLRRIK